MPGSAYERFASFWRAADDTLLQKADEFAAELTDLLRSTLPGDFRVAVEPTARHCVIAILSDDAQEVGKLPLYERSGRLSAASLSISMSLEMDRSDRYLSVVGSSFILWLDGCPVVRLEFLKNANKAPDCHWQFHGANPSFSALLATTRASDREVALERLHFPVGGTRMRPGIEDFIQFLTQECGFQGVQGHRSALSKSRETWRRRQLAAAVRDHPVVARAALFDVFRSPAKELRHRVRNAAGRRIPRW
jgi:hypothetical protein